MGRKFEVCKDYIDKDITLPHRATKFSAGYDFQSAVEIEIPSIWKNIKYALMYKNRELDSGKSFKSVLERVMLVLKPTLVSTGIKAKMENDEYLALYNRSSNPIKRFLLLANGVGVVDSDYYSNESNDGDIAFAFWNFGVFNFVIKKDEVIGQGVFHKFLITDNDLPKSEIRVGGFGSTEAEE